MLLYAECENLHSQLWEAKKALTLQESQLSSAKEEWSLEMDRLIHSSQRECRELLTKLHSKLLKHLFYELHCINPLVGHLTYPQLAEVYGPVTPWTTNGNRVWHV